MFQAMISIVYEVVIVFKKFSNKYVLKVYFIKHST